MQTPPELSEVFPCHEAKKGDGGANLTQKRLVQDCPRFGKGSQKKDWILEKHAAGFKLPVRCQVCKREQKFGTAPGRSEREAPGLTKIPSRALLEVAAPQDACVSSVLPPSTCPAGTQPPGRQEPPSQAPLHIPSWRTWTLIRFPFCYPLRKNQPLTYPWKEFETPC